MAITEVKRLCKGAGQSTYDKLEYIEVYHVFSDDPDELSSAVRAADDGSTSIPELGDAYPDNSSAFCSKVVPQQQENSRLYWIVTVTYETPQSQDDTGGGGGGDPTTFDDRIAWGSRTIQVPVEVDVNGLPIINSAGDKFDPPPTKDKYLLEVSISTNQSSYTGIESKNYMGKINDANVAFTGWTAAAGTLLCASIEAQNKYKNNYEYYEVTYVFVYDPEGWVLSLLNVGFNERTQDRNGNLTLKHIEREDDDGNLVRVPNPVPLYGAGSGFEGQAVPASELARSTSYINYIDFDILEEADFSSMNVTFP